MPSDAAHAFRTSLSTETTATKDEFRLSPINETSMSSQAKVKVRERDRESTLENPVFLPYTKHWATNLHLAYMFSIFSGAMYSPCANLKMFFFLYKQKVRENWE